MYGNIPDVIANAYGGATSTAIIDPFLSSYAVGVMQDTQSALAEFMCPTVAVPAAVGHYIAFDNSNAFQVYKTDRGIGGEANLINLSKTMPTWDCAPQALGTFVDDHEKAQAGASAAMIVQAKIKSLITGATLSHEKKVIDAVAANVSATTTIGTLTNIGNWTNVDNDPIAELDACIEQIATNCGMMPNRAVISIGAFRVLRNHPKVKIRQKVTQMQFIELPEIAQLTMANQCEWRLGVLARDTAGIGGTRSVTNILGNDVYIFIGMPNPTQFDPSFMKNFVVNGQTLSNVISWRENARFSDMYACAWGEDIKVTSTIGVIRITVS